MRMHGCKNLKPPDTSNRYRKQNYMNPPNHPLVSRLGVLLTAFLLLLAPEATAQYQIDSNNFLEGDLQGKESAHNWSLELTEPFNDFRILVDSPTGNVLVLLIPAGSKPTVLTAVQNKGKPYSYGVYGMNIEATQKTGKIPKGRYIVQIKPRREGSNIGTYRLQVLEPKLGTQPSAEPPPTPPAVPPPAPAPPSAPTEPAKTVEPTLAQILAELKSLREAVTKLQSEVQALQAESKKTESPPK